MEPSISSTSLLQSSSSTSSANNAPLLLKFRQEFQQLSLARQTAAKARMANFDLVSFIVVGGPHTLALVGGREQEGDGRLIKVCVKATQGRASWKGAFAPEWIIAAYQGDSEVLGRPESQVTIPLASAIHLGSGQTVLSLTVQVRDKTMETSPGVVCIHMEFLSETQALEATATLQKMRDEELTKA